MPRSDPGRSAGLGEIEERIVGLQEVSGSLTRRFEALLDLDVVDLADFGIGPGSSVAQPPKINATDADSRQRRSAIAAQKGPVAAEAALKAVRGLGKTKEVARVEQYMDIVRCALQHGSTEARSIACNDEAARAVVQLVDRRLPVFEYSEVRNASRTMSARDVEHAKVSLAASMSGRLHAVALNLECLRVMLRGSSR